MLGPDVVKIYNISDESVVAGHLPEARAISASFARLVTRDRTYTRTYTYRPLLINRHLNPRFLNNTTTGKSICCISFYCQISAKVFRPSLFTARLDDPWNFYRNRRIENAGKEREAGREKLFSCLKTEFQMHSNLESAIGKRD